MQYRANQHKEFRSYNAGWDFAKLYYSGSPNLDEVQLSDIVASLRIAAWRYDPPAYRLGFDLGYRACVTRSGNVLPLRQEKLLAEKETTIMGKLTQAQEQTSDYPGFIKAAHIAEIGSTICIRRIEERDAHTGADGNHFDPQWMLTIQVDAVTAGVDNMDDADEQGNVERTLAFTKGKAQPNSRDRVLEQLKGDEPIHNVTLVAIPSRIKSRSAYIDFEEVNGICVCGHDDSTPDLGELDEKPF